MSRDITPRFIVVSPTYYHGIMELSELIDQLCFRLVYGQLSPLRVHADRRLTRSGQKHAELLIVAEEGRPRLESLGRRRIGVLGHDPQKTRSGVHSSRSL